MLKPQQMQTPLPDADAGAATSSGGFWTLKYYQPLFDVDTVQAPRLIIAPQSG